MATKNSPIADAIKLDQASKRAPPPPDDHATHVAAAAALDRGEDVPTDAAPVVVDYMCGLRRIGPSKYVVVSGLIKNGVPDLRVEEVGQSLGHAAEELRAEFQRLVEFIP